MSETEFVVPADFRPSTAEPSGADRGDTPLTDFWCVGNGYEVKGGRSAPNARNPVGRTWMRVHFRGNDVEPIASEVPYPYPTAEFGLFYNDPKENSKARPGQGTSDWDAYCQSIRSIYGEDKEDYLDDLWGGRVEKDDTQSAKPGRRMHLVKLPTMLRVGPNDSNSKWHDEVVPAWKVVEIEGVGVLDQAGDPNAVHSNGAQASVVDINKYVLNLANGKTEDAFNAAATDDPVVMRNPGLMTQIADRTFLTNMVMLGALSKDAAGVFSLK